MEDGKAEGEKKKKKPKRAESKDKIPPTKLDAGAKPAPVAEVPVRYEGCGPCKRAVPDVPLSDAGRTSRDLLFALFFILWSIGDLVIAIVGFQQGSPQALIYGLDFAGNVCGRSSKVRREATRSACGVRRGAFAASCCALHSGAHGRRTRTAHRASAGGWPCIGHAACCARLGGSAAASNSPAAQRKPCVPHARSCARVAAPQRGSRAAHVDVARLLGRSAADTAAAAVSGRNSPASG